MGMQILVEFMGITSNWLPDQEIKNYAMIKIQGLPLKIPLSESDTASLIQALSGVQMTAQPLPEHHVEMMESLDADEQDLYRMAYKYVEAMAEIPVETETNPDDLPEMAGYDYEKAPTVDIRRPPTASETYKATRDHHRALDPARKLLAERKAWENSSPAIRNGSHGVDHMGNPIVRNSPSTQTYEDQASEQGESKLTLNDLFKQG